MPTLKSFPERIRIESKANSMLESNHPFSAPAATSPVAVRGLTPCGAGLVECATALCGGMDDWWVDGRVCGYMDGYMDKWSDI